MIVECIHALLHANGLLRFLWGEAACHIVWLMNRTLTKAVNSMTPYEAAFSKKPNLKDVQEWGEEVWVRTEGGNKLGGQVHEGRWMGIDYYDKTVASVSCLEGEDEEIVKPKTDSPKGKTPIQMKDPAPPLAPELTFKPPNTFENPVNKS